MVGVVVLVVLRGSRGLGGNTEFYGVFGRGVGRWDETCIGAFFEGNGDLSVAGREFGVMYVSDIRDFPNSIHCLEGVECV